MKIRIGILIILYAIITYLLNFEPWVNTQLAVNQANDTVGSTYNFTAYQNLRSSLWIVYLIAPILVFWKYIKSLYIKTSVNNEKGE